MAANEGYDDSLETDSAGPEAAGPEKPPPTLVGIGASAGGIPALKAFFEHVGEDTGLVFVVVMHLSPEHESNLAEVLQPHVRIPVRQVQGRTAIEPDHVYVIPPDRSLAVVDHHLELSRFEEPRGRRAPIDVFFRTIADVHPDGVGVLLSGTGSDGVVGLKAIKEAGGLILAQSPEEAEYDAMPRAAEATGLVDFVLPARELGRKVVEIVARGAPRPAPETEDLGDDEAAVLGEILERLHAQTGHDFSGYKRSTVLRRVGRRMRVAHTDELTAYLGYLRGRPEEAEALMKDLLISVTNFFRDHEAFEALERKVVPRLLKDRSAEDEVRVWVPGCATGEEAYSIAMLVLERVAGRPTRPSIQIFASDLDESALAWAREGLYPEAIVADVSEERLARFFAREGSYYRVRDELRERILFTPHDLLRDPPFSRLDLVSCRNLLIYLRRDLQETVLELFHYALEEEGFLFLGESESVEAAKALFRAVDKEHRIYARNRKARDFAARLPDLPLSVVSRGPRPLRRPRAADPRRRTDGELHLEALEAHAPPSLIVDEERSIVHVSERARRYLRFPAGGPTVDLLQVAREELRPDLRSGLYRALEEGRSTRTDWLPTEIEGRPRRVQVYVAPVASDQERRRALVVFLEAEPEEVDREPPGPATASDRRVAQVERELSTMKERLRQTIEESETRQEELRASNEELQSINEEYKSTLEELETSKEEIQSMNEELKTVNDELKQKIEELATANDVLRNLISATEVAALFLDRRLRIERFTPALGELFHVREVDEGRPLAHVTHELDYEGLEEDCERALETLRPVEREVADGGGRDFLARILPFRTLDDRIAGVVATFTDITRVRRAQERLRRSEERLRLVIEGVREYAIFMVDPDGTINLWNSGAEEIFGYPESEAVGRPLATIFTEEDREEGAVEREMHVAEEEGQARSERWHVRRDGSRFWATGVLTPVHGEDGSLRGFAKLLRDNTRRRAQEEALRRSAERLRQLNETLEARVAERTADLEEAGARIRRLASEVIMAEQRVRRRVARRLHDDLQQLLYALQMKVSMVRTAMEQGEMDRLADLAERLEAGLEDAARTTRQLTVDLSPRTLAGEGLREALTWLVEQMRELHGLEIDVRVEEPYEVGDEDLRVVLFQSVRELLFNVVKHAGVDRATVELTLEEGRRVVRVVDEGRGFDVSAVETHGGGGFGLSHVAERLELVGGGLVVESEPGKGSRLTIRLPDPGKERYGGE